MKNFSENFFELFHLPERFLLNTEELDQAYRRAQSVVHPDRFANSGDAEQRFALQMSAQVNGAYQTLRDPVSRAQYVLSLHQVDAFDESDTKMSGEFLMEQMEARERLAEAKRDRNAQALAQLASAVESQAQNLDRAIGDLLDVQHSWEQARTVVRQRKFLDKLRADIAEAIFEVED